MLIPIAKLGFDLNEVIFIKLILLKKLFIILGKILANSINSFINSGINVNKENTKINIIIKYTIISANILFIFFLSK